MNARDPRERDLVKCEDMRIHAERAREFLGDRTLAEFLEDELVQAAVIRCIEVIGEAARLVSDETRARASEIPWTLITGMRNVLAHEYGTVLLDNCRRDWTQNGRVPNTPSSHSIRMISKIVPKPIPPPRYGPFA